MSSASTFSSSHSSDKLRILIADNFPPANSSCPRFPQFAPTVNCPYPGWCLEIIDVLVRSGNIPHEYVIDRNNSAYVDWGRLQESGSFSGVLGRVESGEVDMACLFFQKSIVRLAHFDFSVAVSEIRPTFIVREVPITIWSLLFNCLKPYDTWVWISMLVALIAQMVVWTMIGRSEQTVGLREPRRVGQYFAWDVFEQMFNGGDQPFYFLSGKLTRLVFCIFQVGLLFGMYTALLLTALITPNDMAPIRSQTDAVRLIQSGAYKLISDKSKWQEIFFFNRKNRTNYLCHDIDMHRVQFAQEIAHSSEAMFTELREATATNPIVDPVNDTHALDLVGEGNYIYQTQTDSATMVAVSRRCYTFVFTEGLPFRSAHFLMRKGSPWMEALNMEIARNYAMIDQVYRRYFEDRQSFGTVPHCPVDPLATPGASDPLNVWSVFGIFVLAACGLIISTAFLLAEIAYFHSLFSRRNK